MTWIYPSFFFADLPVGFNSNDDEIVPEGGQVELCLQHLGNLAREATVFINAQLATASGTYRAKQLLCVPYIGLACILYCLN